MLKSYKYLLSVSAGASKLFCCFNSVIKLSFSEISAGVGKAVEMGGVTPHCRVCCEAAMLEILQSS